MTEASTWTSAYQSIFLGGAANVYQAFGRWLEYLRKNGLFDANVAAWERRSQAEEAYDFLVVDEVQDITTVELRLALSTLKDKRSSCSAATPTRSSTRTCSPGLG